MNTSDSTTRPSSLLALICLTVVHRYKSEWVAVSISTAARSEGLNSERISRLTTRAIAAFEQVVAALTRMGRPPVDCVAEQVTQQLALLKALLEVATSSLSSKNSFLKSLKRCFALHLLCQLVLSVTG